MSSHTNSCWEYRLHIKQCRCLECAQQGFCMRNRGSDFGHTLCENVLPSRPPYRTWMFRKRCIAYTCIFVYVCIVHTHAQIWPVKAVIIDCMWNHGFLCISVRVAEAFLRVLTRKGSFTEDGLPQYDKQSRTEESRVQAKKYGSRSIGPLNSGS